MIDQLESLIAKGTVLSKRKIRQLKSRKTDSKVRELYDNRYDLFGDVFVRRNSCTALALAAYCDGYKINRELLRAAVALTNSAFSIPTGKRWFGLSGAHLRSLYNRLGLQFYPDPLGEFIPDNAIISFLNRNDRNQGHVAACVGGILHDNNIGRDMRIAGYYAMPWL